MKYFKAIFLSAIMLLYSACADSRFFNAHTKQREIALADVADTLKFKSGIRSILQDSEGNYWFGSDQEGVCKFDGETFTYYTTEDGFCGKQVIFIKEDETGKIWFGTSSGLCYFDGIKFSANRSDSPGNYLGREEDAAWSINGTDLWFPGAKGNELIRIEKGKIQTINFPFQIPSKANPGDYGITGLCKSKSEGLWIAHYSGVSYYDGLWFQFISDSTVHYDGKTKYMHVRSILEDSKGRLWIGNNGIGVQLKEKDSIIHFSEKQNLFKGDLFGVKSPKGTLMHVFAIKEDSYGNIWFGDRDTGAWRFDGKEMKNFILDSALSTQHIWDIFEDRRGNLLFASGERGVYRFNGNGFDRVF